MLNCPFYNVDAKLSVFTMLVPNCPFYYLGAKLSVCLFGAKLSVFTILVPYCPMPNCLGAKLSGAKLPYHQLDMLVIVQENTLMVPGIFRTAY